MPLQHFSQIINRNFQKFAVFHLKFSLLIDLYEYWLETWLIQYSLSFLDYFGLNQLKSRSSRCSASSLSTVIFFKLRTATKQRWFELCGLLNQNNRLKGAKSSNGIKRTAELVNFLIPNVKFHITQRFRGYHKWITINGIKL